MQAKIKTQPVDYFDPVFEGAFEAPIDTEYNLPDYCPDIQKLLKCQAVPEISSYVISEDTLTCDGVCDIRVLYLDAKGDCVRCCDFTKDFSASVKIRTTEEKAVAWVRTTVEHMTCRAVSARRIDLHISVSVSALAVAQKREMITCGVEDPSIQRLTSSRTASQAVNAVCHQFTAEDVFPLKNGKPPIETILRKSTSCRVRDCRLTEGRMTVSGTAELSFLYLSSVDGSTVEKMTADLDFEQVIDCSGAREGCVCDLKAVVGETAIQPKEDDVGEYTSVSVLMKLFLVVFLYEPCEVEMVDDAYSVKAPLSLKYTRSSLMQVQGVRRETLKKKSTISVTEDEIEKILDLWCEQDSVQTTCDKGKLNYRVRCTACMLFQGSHGRILYAEKALDYNFTAELGDDVPKKTDTSWHTNIWEYRIADKNTVELTAETEVSVFLYSRSGIEYLASAEADENAAPYGSSSRLLVYYASAGERLWDIAKSHHALLEDIRAQNDLYDENVPEDRPIILCNR